MPTLITARHTLQCASWFAIRVAAAVGTALASALRRAGRVTAVLGVAAWQRLLRHTERPRHWAWAWWHYGREPLTTENEANAALSLIGYDVKSWMQLTRIRPGLRGWRGGVWVTIEPRLQRSALWAMQRVRWVDDPIELWLLRSATQQP